MAITHQFLRSPRTVGAIAASSRRLAGVMTSGLGLERARVVVELGPGTGVVTEEVLARIAPGTTFVAIEINPLLAQMTSVRFAGRSVEVVCGSAECLGEWVPGPVDVVVSGLPWTVMPWASQVRILDAVTRTMADDGRFTTFGYVHAVWTPPARRLVAALGERFQTVGRSPVIWPNLPPAVVHRAARPRFR